MELPSEFLVTAPQRVSRRERRVNGCVRRCEGGGLEGDGVDVSQEVRFDY